VILYPFYTGFLGGGANSSALQITMIPPCMADDGSQTLARPNLPPVRVVFGNEGFPANAKPIQAGIRRAAASDA
jgi:hypothetical protein